MEIRSRFSLIAAALVVMALAACSDDSSSPTGGTSDKTPPGVNSVTPVDAYHIDITFTEQVTKGSAEDEGNYTIVESAGVPVGPRGANKAPGDPVTVTGATLKGDKKTVTLATETSMAGTDFDVSVTGVSDVTGNKITEPISKPFTGSDTPDDSAPTIVTKAPLPGGTNISIGAVVTVTFSEAIESATTSWTSLGGPVAYSSAINGATLTLTPNSPLAFDTEYTVDVAGTDFAGNAGTNTEWKFTTSSNNDHTPPTLVSTVPANLATNVDVDANLSITFSEAVNQTELDAQLIPDAGEGVVTWSNGGKTATFDPTAPLMDNQQYTLTIYPQGVFDLAGNGIEGLHTVVFTTAAQLADGSIAGTITGDPGSPAADPTGAALIAAGDSPFTEDSFSIIGSTTVATNNTYSVIHLPDGYYYLISVLDTNDDGNLDPDDGDAIGGYGVDFEAADLEADSVVIDGGTHATGKNFKLYDPSVASGTVTYNGSTKGEYQILVGLFDTAGFSPTDEPAGRDDAINVDHEWSFNTLDGEFPEGNYYVGAYMDVNINGTYDPTIDPAGFYGGLPAPTAINMSSGHDTNGIVINMIDPITVTTSPVSVLWPKAKHNAAFQRMVEIVRQSQRVARH